MNAATFRADFPEFADEAKYPDALINLWLGIGAKRLPEDRWADLLDHGLGLFTAHHLVLARRNADAAAKGGAPGAAAGILSSKSVGPASASYDTGSAALEGGGHWNLTAYGTQFLALAQLVGAGGIQL